MKLPDAIPEAHRANWDEQLVKTLGFALDKVENFGCAVDAGAYAGTWSAVMAEKFAVVHAFEPSGKNREYMKATLRGIDNVVVHDEAVSSHEHEIMMRVANAGFLKIGGDVSFNAVSIDSLELDDVGLIKLDIEGCELDGITGAMYTIERCKPIMIVETKREKYEIDNAMWELGYYVIQEPYQLSTGKITPDTIYKFRRK